MVDAGTAALAGPGARPVVAVAPPRRRRPPADDVLTAIEGAGAGAVVLARPPGSAPGMDHLGPVARLLSAPCVRAPADVHAAAWVVTAASHPEFGDDELVRRLEVLAGVASAGGTSLPRRAVDGGPAMPSLRPGVLARWAGCAWRPCGRCETGGGLAGASCGRCGATTLGVTA